MVSLRLYDTATRSQREFIPLRAGGASIYVCGATVQGMPHIGHVRSGLNYDVMRRWLSRGGLDVALVRNVTDIDDKIIRRAQEEKVEFQEVTKKYTAAFHQDLKDLGLIPPAEEPRATTTIKEIVKMITPGNAVPADITSSQLVRE